MKIFFIIVKKNLWQLPAVWVADGSFKEDASNDGDCVYERNFLVFKTVGILITSTFKLSVEFSWNNSLERAIFKLNFYPAFTYTRVGGVLRASYLWLFIFSFFSLFHRIFSSFFFHTTLIFNSQHNNWMNN